MPRTARVGFAVLVVAAFASVGIVWVGGGESGGQIVDPGALPGGFGNERASAQLAPGARSAIEIQGSATSAPALGASEGEGVQRAETIEVALEARLVDKNGAPIAGGRLELYLEDSEEADARSEPSETDGRVRVLADVPTDAGVSQRWWARGEPAPIYYLATRGFLASEVGAIPFRPGVVVDLGDLVLTPRGRVTGNVLQSDGTPATGAWVYAWFSASFEADRSVGVDDEGHFELPLLPLGPVRIEAAPPWYLGAEAGAEVEVFAGEDSGPLQLTLWEAPLTRLLRGQVVDEGDDPVGGIEVHGEEGEHLRFRDDTGTDGRFTLTVPAEPDSLRLTFRDPKDRYSHRTFDIADPTVELTVRLVAPRVLDLVVVGSDGPVAWPWIELTEGDLLYGSRQVQGRADGTAATNWPDSTFQVKVFGDGYEQRTLTDVDPTKISSPFVIELQRGSYVSGRVVHRGRPVAGARVGLGSWNQPGSRSFSEPPIHPAPFDIVAYAGQGDGRETDERGRFTLPLHRGGKHALRVVADGFGESYHGPYEWPQDSFAEGLEVEIDRAGRLEGTVIARSDQSSGQLMVGISCGNGIARTQLVGEDLSYSFHGLAPGGYQVRLCNEDFAPIEPLRPEAGFLDADPPAWDVQVQPGKSAHYDLDIRDHRAFLVRGVTPFGTRMQLHVPIADDLLLEAPEELGARFRFNHGGAVATESDEDGSFEIALSRPGPRVFRFFQHGWKPTPQWYEIVDVLPGTQTWEPSRALGRITIDVGDGFPPDHVVTYYWSDERSKGRIPLAPLEPGTVTVPTGDGWIEYGPSHAGWPDRERQTRIDVTVPKSEPLLLQLP